MKHPLAEAYDHYLESLSISRGIKNSARHAFGSTLRTTRKSLGMSVRELGNKIGITGSLINQVEMSGKSVLKKSIIERIVELCYAKNLSSPKQDSGSPESESSKSAVGDSK